MSSDFCVVRFWYLRLSFCGVREFFGDYLLEFFYCVSFVVFGIVVGSVCFRWLLFAIGFDCFRRGLIFFFSW